MPFTTEDETRFPVPVLAQVDRKNFEICVPFKYRRADTTNWVVVPKNSDFKRTDLASVPGFLLWLVPRYGVHTLAALLHDQLVNDPSKGGRIEADTIFRDALGELGVPWIRRWIMWAAVSLNTTWKAGLLGKLRLVVWGIGVLVATAFFWQHAFAAATVLGPWPAVLVFGRGMGWDLTVAAGLSLVFAPRIGLGLVAGATVVLVFIPTIAVLGVLGVYLGLEVIARVALWLYNRLPARVTRLTAVDNVPAIMSLADEGTLLTGAPRGCPECAGSSTSSPESGEYESGAS